MDGEAIYELFYMVAQPVNQIKPPVDIPTIRTRDCCQDFFLKVYADPFDNGSLRNDRSGFIFSFDDSVTSATLILQRFVNGNWENTAPLNDNTFGVFYPLGFFTNNSNERFIRYDLYWQKVIMGIGNGKYRIKCSYVFPFAPAPDIFSFEFCLEQYTADRVNGTVRLEYYMNGIFGDVNNDEHRNDYGNINFYNSFRLPGYFGFPESKYEQEQIQYTNGQRAWVKDEQEPEFTLKLRMIPGFVHDILRTDFMQADNLLITDYNAKNPLKYVAKKVIKNSDYAPAWNRLQSKLADVELKFKQEFNNLKKLHC